MCSGTFTVATWGLSRLVLGLGGRAGFPSSKVAGMLSEAPLALLLRLACSRERRCVCKLMACPTVPETSADAWRMYVKRAATPLKLGGKASGSRNLCDSQL